MLRIAEKSVFRSFSEGEPVVPREETDRQLVERVQRGDKRAYDVLVLKYQHKIVGLVSRYLRDQDEVQDVTQEAFIKAYRALPNFRGDSAFYTWLYRICLLYTLTLPTNREV